MEKKKKEFQSFRALFIAPSNYGKSYQISHFVLQKIKAGMFKPQRIIIISPTHKSDPSQLILINECLKKEKDFLEENCFLHIDDKCLETLENIFATNQKIKDMGMKIHHFLVLMDDVISESALKKGGGILQTIATQGRHYNISSIISLQAYRSSISSIVRSQCSIVAIGRLLSVNEIEDLASIYNQGLGESKKEATKKFLELWEQAIQKNNNHGFLVIHTYNQYGQKRIQMGGLDSSFVD